MSIISKNRRTVDKLREEFMEKRFQLMLSELNAMDEMLDVLRNTDTPMSAAQIEAVCTSGISRYEIAGNLTAMQEHTSRYDNLRSVFSKKVTPVNIPHKNGREYIAFKGGGTRIATFVEIDKNGEIIPNTKQTRRIKEARKYIIEGR